MQQIHNSCTLAITVGLKLWIGIVQVEYDTEIYIFRKDSLTKHCNDMNMGVANSCYINVNIYRLSLL